MNIIELKNISKIYGKNNNEVIALKNINLKINQGDYITILGTSGSGKSTLLNIIGCLDKPTNGKYLYENEDIIKFNDKKVSKLRNDKFGFVLQFFGLINDESVYSNVSVPLEYSKKKNKKELIENILQKLSILDKIKTKPSELSGGQCQRVAIARALVNNPDIILADEPTGALDKKTGTQVIDILEDLNKQGKTVIIVTHDVNIAKRAKRVIRLEDGKVISDVVNHLE